MPSAEFVEFQQKMAANPVPPPTGAEGKAPAPYLAVVVP